MNGGKKLVLIRGPLLTISGYGVHARQVFRWLESLPNIDLRSNITPWGITSWIVNPDFEKGIAGRIMKSSSGSLPQKPDVTFQVQLPNEWDPSLGVFNVGVTAAVETDICNPGWVDCCNKMQAIIVPSQHTANVIRRSGKLKVPLYVVGEAFIDECLESTSFIDLNIDTNFNFLLIGQLTDHNPFLDRKNMMFTLKWLCEEFAGDQNVGIVIKTNSGRGTKMDKQITKRVLDTALKEMRKGLFPRVHFLHGHLEHSEVAGLYKHPKIKALASATRGEGFGLPLLEAAASGLPVIATDWSAHKDFLDLGKWLKVECVVSELPKQRIDGNIFVSGAKWAEPDEISFKRAARSLLTDHKLHKQNALELAQRVSQKFSIGSIMADYSKALRGTL